MQKSPTNPKPLTQRQRQILELIRQRVVETGYPPSRAEIAEAFGFRSLTAVADHLKALARKGAIELRGHEWRGIRLLDAPPTGIPVVGQVAAGSPILATEHLEEYREVDPSLFQPRAHFLLRVRGSSMRDAGILDGDLLAVHKTREAENGQIVVARLEEEVTVKRLQHDRAAPHRVTLVAANPDYAPIEVDLRQQSLTIEGLGVGLLRNFRTEKWW